MVANANIDVQATTTRLQSLTIFELRGEWRRHHRMPPPARLSRDLLIRGIAYKVQEHTYGGLSKAMLRRIARVIAEPGPESDRAPPSQIMLKPGTRLVREWHGETHSVLVNGDSFEWRGRRFASLSQIACAITGTHWSGPRFFGLNRSSGCSARSGAA